VESATGGVYAHDFAADAPTALPVYVPGAAGTCVGCHAISNDGQRAVVATAAPAGADAFGADAGTMRTELVDLATRAGIAAAPASPGFQAFTSDHTWMVASAYTTQRNTGFDVYDQLGALVTQAPLGGILGTQPTFAPNDRLLMFVVPQDNTISKVGDHHFMGGSIFTASFDPTSGALGPPNVILHAPNVALSDGGGGGRSFYYPSIDPTGAFIMFDEANGGDAFFNAGARVKLLHNDGQSGGSPIDLPALNTADNISNSWPRFSPAIDSYRARKIIWVTFTSTRDYGLRLAGNGALPSCYPPGSPGYDEPQGASDAACARPQIWMAAVVVEPGTELDLPDRSYPAFWLPYQDTGARNHNAQWASQIPSTFAQIADGGACVAAGGACGAAGVCCADTLCCAGTCGTTCPP
jgi:hypothetical protein